MDEARKIKALFVIVIINTILLIGVLVNLNYGAIMQLTNNAKGDNETSEQNYIHITGIVTKVGVFVQDGNTRWIMDITGGNKSNYFIAKAELLNLIVIEMLSDVKIGDNVTAMIGQNNMLMAIKIN